MATVIKCPKCHAPAEMLEDYYFENFPDGTAIEKYECQRCGADVQVHYKVTAVLTVDDFVQPTPAS